MTGNPAFCHSGIFDETDGRSPVPWAISVARGENTGAK
jgi:hypothetical protein